MMAGKSYASDEWNSVEFPGAYNEPPVVLTQITTQEVRKPYVTRQRYVTTENFEVRIQSEENAEVTETEEISWIAWGLTTDHG